FHLTENIVYSAQCRVSIQVAKTGGGTTMPSGVSWYNCGAAISLTAEPGSGFEFIGWQISGGSQITIANPKPPTATAVIGGPGTIYAKFKSA
ncbi:MAG: hypothetical protein OK456_08640, partial [Thaumarchaeota archaeon]|nr:hypothetical protein [Nitrososphaerota archaeon]